MTSDELKSLLRNSKAAWQDEFGLRGPQPRFEPQRAAELAPVQPFQVKEEPGVIVGGSVSPRRPNPDGTYDYSGDNTGGGSGNTQTVFGAVNGVPATLQVLATGPWVPV